MRTSTPRVVPVTDEYQLLAWHSVQEETIPHDHPGLLADPLEEYLPLLAGPRADWQMDLLLGLRDDEPVASGRVALPLLDNTTSASVDVHVRLGERGRGYGRAVLAQALDQIRRAGRTLVHAQIGEPLDAEGPGARFAAAAGARRVLSEVRRSLDLTSPDHAALARLRAEASRAAAAYEVVQWLDRAPDDVVDDAALLLGRMSTDAPLEDMTWEPERWDAVRYRAKEEESAASGRRRVATAARHRDSGRVVAYTDIGVNRSRPEIAYQWDTIVAPEHRGHRLGVLVKVDNLALVRRTVPLARSLQTWNAGSNAHMVAINEAMGFVPVDRWSAWELALGG